MIWRTKSLHQQITLVIVSAVVVLALSFAALALWSSQRYHDEVTQKLYDTLAQYIVDHQSEPLISQQGQANQKLLKQLAMNVMMINPLVEVYLLSPQGTVLGHALPDADVQASQVNLLPIQSRLRNGPDTLIMGQNPRHPDQQQLFSVAALKQQGQLQGYLYVVLNSQQADSIAERFQISHISQLIIFAITTFVVLTLFVLSWIFRRLTRPLRQLTADISQFQSSDWMGPQLKADQPGQEIAQLQSSFHAMQQRIVSQFNHLQENDRLRRELITNVSHDLRTPLASLQGYIESLLLRRDQLSDTEVNTHLEVAHRSCQRLTALVSALFELSRLDAGHVEPEMESFSLLELIYDVTQDYQLSADHKNIELMVINHCQPPCQVTADLRLMERVIQNLLDNALRHTPQGGTIVIELNPGPKGIQLAVSDNGKGIDAQHLPHIFESRYCAGVDAASIADRPGGTGLGLSIVKRILELHNSSIKVISELGKGTRFEFLLTY